MKFAASAFDDEALKWWDDLEDCRCYYSERSISTWYDMKVAMRKQFRQNGCYVRPDNDTMVGSQAKEQCCPKLARLDKKLSNLQEQVANIMSLLSKLEELSPPLNEVSNINVKTPKKEESLEPEQVEIPMVDEKLTASMEIHEDEGMESKEFDHDFLVEVKAPHQREAVFLFPCKYLIPIVQSSQSLVLVPLKFTKLYHVSMREENKLLRVEKEIVCDEIREIELMRRKKRKKVRNRK